MKPRTVLICLFLLVTLLVDVLVAFVIGRYEVAPDWITLVASALLWSQIDLLVIWLALGKTLSPLRLIVAVLILSFWSWLFGLAGLDIHPVVRTLFMIACSLPLLALRSLGAGIVDVFALPDVEDGEPDLRRFQFSILYLMGWITAVAVTFGTLEYLRPDESLPLAAFVEFADWTALLLIEMVAILICALWTSLGTGWIVVRIFSLPVVAGAAFASPAPGYARRYPEPFFLSVLFLVGSLLVFRMAGYRFRCRKRRAQKTTASPSDSNASVDGSGTGVTDE